MSCWCTGPPTKYSRAIPSRARTQNAAAVTHIVSFFMMPPSYGRRSRRDHDEHANRLIRVIVAEEFVLARPQRSRAGGYLPARHHDLLDLEVVAFKLLHGVVVVDHFDPKPLTGGNRYAVGVELMILQRQ